ncbi:hypothetical protein OF83DRAFT_423028 [Amylostereum chailletii]|nr:hypothetical protein OF83DRAFT_423028 [Amylostereum chailletii]
MTIPMRAFPFPRRDGGLDQRPDDENDISSFVSMAATATEIPPPALVTTMSSSSKPTPSSSTNSGGHLLISSPGKFAAIVVACCLCIICCIGGLIYYLRVQRNKRNLKRASTITAFEDMPNLTYMPKRLRNRPPPIPIRFMSSNRGSDMDSLPPYTASPVSSDYPLGKAPPRPASSPGYVYTSESPPPKLHVQLSPLFLPSIETATEAVFRAHTDGKEEVRGDPRKADECAETCCLRSAPPLYAGSEIK